MADLVARALERLQAANDKLGALRGMDGSVIAADGYLSSIGKLLALAINDLENHQDGV